MKEMKTVHVKATCAGECEECKKMVDDRVIIHCKGSSHLDAKRICRDCANELANGIKEVCQV